MKKLLSCVEKELVASLFIMSPPPRRRGAEREKKKKGRGWDAGRTRVNQSRTTKAKIVPGHHGIDGTFTTECERKQRRQRTRPCPLKIGRRRARQRCRLVKWDKSSLKARRGAILFFHITAGALSRFVAHRIGHTPSHSVKDESLLLRFTFRHFYQTRPPQPRGSSVCARDWKDEIGHIWAGKKNKKKTWRRRSPLSRLIRATRRRQLGKKKSITSTAAILAARRSPPYEHLVRP